jgi:hypothetical protein
MSLMTTSLLVLPIPSLVYLFLFSLRESNYLPPEMLNLAHWKELLAKLLCQRVPIAFNFKGRKRVPHFCFTGKKVGKEVTFESFIGNSFLTHRVA